jgi:hypothetical protein
MFTSFNIFFPEMSTSYTSSDLELTGFFFFFFAGERMRELEIENDDDEEEEDGGSGGGGGDGNVNDRTKLNDQFTAVYYLQNEVAVATHKTYVLHMNASV